MKALLATIVTLLILSSHARARSRVERRCQPEVRLLTVVTCPSPNDELRIAIAFVRSVFD